MNFLRIFESTWKNLSSQVLKFAEETSSCSDIPTHYWTRGDGIRNAREALATLVALDIVTPGVRSYHKVEPLRQHIAKMCANANEQGEWKIVKSYLLTVKPFVIYESITFILQNMSEQDYFGNFLKLVKQMIRTIKVKKTYSSVTEDKRPVTKKVWKRGYDDKGSLRPEHQKGRIYRIPQEEVVEIIPREPRSHQWYDRKQYCH